MRGVPIGPNAWSVREKERSAKNEIVAPRIYNYQRPGSGWEGGSIDDPLKASEYAAWAAKNGIDGFKLGAERPEIMKALLEGAPADAHRALFAAAVIRLAKQLGLRVVADGVESRAQLQMLRQEGCDAVQAFLSCPPLPAGACTDWLRSASRRG